MTRATPDLGGPAGPPRIGPFTLVRPIGHGGVATVWEARGPGPDVPAAQVASVASGSVASGSVASGSVASGSVASGSVAIKIVSGDDAARARRELREEVRAQAVLDHPHIVSILDHGVLDAEAAASLRAAARPGPEVAGAGGRPGRGWLRHARPGDPWLAMALAPHGSLDRFALPLTWDGIRDLLVMLLDALAHAHARGVIHRDIKPENILVFDLPPGPGLAPIIRLGDFGIAHALGRLGRGRQRVGTPRAMAPEQFLGDVAEQGPWTDLYAVGCVAYELITGRPPFPGEDFAALRSAHLLQDPRPIEEDAGLPAGVAAWVDTLLAKEPHRRFAFAADALAALRALGHPRRPVLRPGGRSREATTLGFTAACAETVEWNDDGSEAGGGSGVEPASRPRPAPFPSRWQPEPHPWARPRRTRPGLGLWGLRRPPLVGREAELERIWQVFADLRRTRRPRLVLLHGPAGVGRSRLAEAAAERFHEVGGGPVLRVRDDLGRSGERNFVQALAAATGCVEDDPQEGAARVGRLLHRWGVDSPYERRVILGLLLPGRGGPERPRRERHAALLRVLRHLAGERAILVVVDDLQLDSDLVDFVRFALRAREDGDLPVGFLLTLRDPVRGAGTVTGALDSEAARRHRRLEDRLRAILELRASEAIRVGALSRAEQLHLVHGLLGLSEGLAREVVDRTQGNPMFAVQLVDGWVRRGLLQPSPDGLVLREGASLDLPEDIAGLWDGRVAAVLGLVPPTDADQLAIAAVLGMEVVEREWRGVLDAAGITWSPGLADVPVQEGVWTQRPDGWAFVHALFREALLRRLRRDGRVERWHALCASWLERSRTSTRQGAALACGEPTELLARIAHHHVQAGDRDRAATALIEEAERRVARGEIALAGSSAQAARRCLRRIGAPPDDPRWGRVWLAAAEVACAQGHLAEARRLVRDTEQRAWQARWSTLHTRTMHLRGRLAELEGELRLARDEYLGAERWFRRTGHAAEARACLVARSRVAVALGDLEEARELATRAGQEAGMARDEAGRLEADLALGTILRLQGEVDAAVAVLDDALRGFEALGELLPVARCHRQLALAARHHGDLAAERRHLDRALRGFTAVGAAEADEIRLLIADGLLRAGRVSEARAMLDGAARRFAENGQRAELGVVHLLGLSAAAHEEDWVAWRLHHRRARRLLDASGWVALDFLDSVERAARIAEERGQPERAAEARALAAARRRVLGPARFSVLAAQPGGGEG